MPPKTSQPGRPGHGPSTRTPPSGRRAPDITASKHAGQRTAPRERRSPSPADTLSHRLLWLDARRRELRCTQAELARALGVSPSGISRLFGPDDRRRPHALTSAEGLERVELALRLLGQVAPNARAARPVSRDSAPRAQAPHSPLTRHSGAQHPAQPALLSDSGVYPVPSIRARKATPHAYRLLLAEDDADTVNLYEMVFADGDDVIQYQLTVARTAAECIELLRGATVPFDLLVMDLGIAETREAAPETRLLPWLHAHAELRPPRVLVVSGVSPYQLQARIADLKALNAAFLPKPFDVEEVLATVRALCEGSALPEGGMRLAETPI